MNRAAIDKVQRKRRLAWMLLVPSVIYILVFLIVPMFNMLILSLKGQDGTLSFENYAYVLTNPVIRNVFAETLRISLIVMIICLVLGYPVAYIMTVCSRKMNQLITLCIMIPFWTSLLVRTYAWMILLQQKGVVNQWLLSTGIIGGPVKLMYNTTGLVIGMVHVMLPYMILSLYSVMDGIDRSLITASSNLGANGMITFFKIYLPLSMNGVISGCVLVFVLNLGFYILPALMGGSNNIMVSQVIAEYVNKMLNWNLAAALSFILLLGTLLIVGVSRKVFKIEKLM